MTLIINDTEENKIFKLKSKKIIDENHDKNQFLKIQHSNMWSYLIISYLINCVLVKTVFKKENKIVY